MPRVTYENYQAEDKFGLRWHDAYLDRPCFSKVVRDWFDVTGIRMPKIDVVFEPIGATRYVHVNETGVEVISHQRYVACFKWTGKTLTPHGNPSRAVRMHLDFETDADLLLFKLRWC